MDIVILAAGLGSRFFSNGSKVTVNFWGVRVIDLLCKEAKKLVPNHVYVVVKKEHDLNLLEGVIPVTQKDAYGTGAAAQSYYNQCDKSRDVLIIPGDVPLITAEVMQKFDEAKNEADLIVGIMPMPVGKEYYGRVILEDGFIKKIVEYKYHNEKTDFANSGIVFISKKILHLLDALTIGGVDEIYLTEIVELALQAGYTVKPLMIEIEDALGFNTVSELNSVLDLAQKKWRNKALNSNVVFYDINTVYFSHDTEIEAGAIVEPYVSFFPGVKLTKHAVVKSFSCLGACKISGTIGPFANIRSGTIEEHAEVGAFVEVNRSNVGECSKIKHLSYLGDVHVEKNVNIGAGCVICNYDGKQKHQTKIKESAFVGANTTLIAPLVIGKGALLAAGSTFVTDVPENKLAIARSYQTIKDLKNT